MTGQNVPPIGVRLEAVHKSFDDVAAVNGLDLDAYEGEFLTLLGPSGSGKTTSLRLIGGFEPPDAGRIFLGSQDVTDVPAYLRPVNTVFQTYALFPHLTVTENIAFGLRIKGLADAEVRREVGKHLELVGMSGMERRKPHQLSGGEQQRVALARALVMKPLVLLLDEPLGSLDLKLRQRMELELKMIQRALGMTFIYVTHDQEEALAMSDRIAVMDKGRLQQSGTPVDIYERPETRFVAGFLGDANFFDGEVLDRNREVVRVRVPELGEFRGLVAPNGGPGSTANVTVAVRPEYLVCSRDLSPAGPNRIPGTIAEILMAGTLDRKVLVRLANGQMAQVLVRAGSAEGLEVGNDVRLVWPDERTIILER